MLNSERERIKVWLVDDEKPFRDVMDAAINESATVRCTKCLENAKELIQSLKGETPPDVILLDVHMPGASGIEIIPKIRELAPETYIVMLTGSSGDETIIGALVAGAHGYVLKTGNTDREVIKAVQEVTTNGIAMDPLALKKVIKLMVSRKTPAEDYGLTPAEKTILEFIVGDGLTPSEISDRLSLSILTIRSHIKHIHKKLNVHSLNKLASKTSKEHLI